MKKIIIMLLIFALVCNFAGCSTDKINSDTEKQTLSIDAVSENEPSELKTEAGLHTTTDNPLNTLETELESMKEEPAESHKQDESVTGTITNSEGAEATTHTTNHAAETEPMETDPSHVHSFTSRVVPPTCTEKGYTEYTCSCGYSYKDDWAEPLGHDYVDTVVAATTEHGGYTEHVCSRCGYTYRDNETPKLESTRWDNESAVASLCAEMNAYIKSLGFDNNSGVTFCWAGQISTSSPYATRDSIKQQIINGINDFSKIYSDIYVAYVRQEDGDGFYIRLQYCP